MAKRAYSVPKAGDVGIDGFGVTPNDSNTFDRHPRALYVGTGGDVTIRTPQGSTLAFKNVPDGGYVFCRCDQVRATGTDASDIVALY